METVAAASKWDGWRAAFPQRAVRTTLRELRASDAAFLGPLFLDPEVHRFAPGLPNTPTAIQQYIEWAERMHSEGRKVCLAMTLEEQVIGVIHAWPLEPTAKTVEWGFVLGRAYWGQGLLQEAAAAFVSTAVQQLGVECLEARTAVMNARGVAALTRLGAHPEGVLRQAFGLNEERVDCLMWSILAAEWSSGRSHRYSQYAIPHLRAVPAEGALADAASQYEPSS